MQKDRKEKSFIKKPIFPGGLKAMRQIIQNNLIYPSEALDKKIEGTVFLRYEINYLGRVTGAKILSGVGYGCDEEAIRLVHLFKFEVPRGPRKIKVSFHKTIKIHFRLHDFPEKQPGPHPSNFSYMYQTTSKNENKKTRDDQKGYHYTINWQ